jgi:hypothetical protein
MTSRCSLQSLSSLAVEVRHGPRNGGTKVLSAAAADLARVGSAISGATEAATATTRGMLPAAADEVSTQIAEFFAGHADQYRAVSAQAAAFHTAFVQAVKASAASYASAETANASLLQQATSASSSEIALIMGGTFNPQPTPGYVAAINSLFIQSNPNYTGYSPFGLYTPESGGVIPLVSGLTLDQSAVQGEIILINAIMNMSSAGPRVRV